MTDDDHRPDYLRVGPLKRAEPDGGVYRAAGKVPCPSCGYRFDAWGQHEGGDERPENGDYTMCFRCAHIMRFVVGPMGLALRTATTDEEAEFHQLHPGAHAELLAFIAQRESGR